MDRYVKLKMVHPQSKDGDVDVHIKLSSILTVMAASAMDRRQRQETNSIVTLINGGVGRSGECRDRHGENRRGAERYSGRCQ